MILSGSPHNQQEVVPAGKFNRNIRKSVSRMVHNEMGACKALGKLQLEQSKRGLGGVPSGMIRERKVD